MEQDDPALASRLNSIPFGLLQSKAILTEYSVPFPALRNKSRWNAPHISVGSMSTCPRDSSTERQGIGRSDRIRLGQRTELLAGSSIGFIVGDQFAIKPCFQMTPGCIRFPVVPSLGPSWNFCRGKLKSLRVPELAKEALFSRALILNSE